MVLYLTYSKFFDAKDETEYTLATLELIGRVHDTHAIICGSNPILRIISDSDMLLSI